MAKVQDASWHETHHRGPWPFVTLRHFEHELGHHHVWAARPHRKQLRRGGSIGLRVGHTLAHPEHWLFRPERLNWWIGTVFCVGAFLFALGGTLSLWPALAEMLGITRINAVFFMGSIPFTTAAYLQLFQAANMPSQTESSSRPNSPTDPAESQSLNRQTAHRSTNHRVRFFGWFPSHPGWLSCALQFPGTVLFNFNTFDAMLPGLGTLGEEMLIWVPNLLGSILFLASGWLAWVETCHAHFAWRPSRLPWQIALWNLMGCVSFMAAAILAVVLMDGSVWLPRLATFFTLTGGVCFFVGSFLMLPEDSA